MKIVAYTALFFLAFIATSNNARAVNIKIRLASSGKQISSINVSEKTTIFTIKQIIEKEYGYPVESQQFFVVEEQDPESEFILSEPLSDNTKVGKIMRKYSTDSLMLQADSNTTSTPAED